MKIYIESDNDIIFSADKTGDVVLPNEIWDMAEKISKERKKTTRFWRKPKQSELDELERKEEELCDELEKLIGEWVNDILFIAEKNSEKVEVFCDRSGKEDDIHMYVLHICKEGFFNQLEEKCKEKQIEFISIGVENTEQYGDENRMEKENQSVLITRYTQDAWEKVTGKTESEWQVMTFATNAIYSANILLAEQNMNAKDFSEIRMITIDQEYFDWLEANNLKESTKNRSLYCVSMSEEKATELMKKYKYDRVLMMTFFFVPVCHIKNQFPLSTSFSAKGIKNEVTEILETVYGKGKVYVSEYFIRPTDYMQNQFQIDSLALHYFEEGQNVRLMKYEEQRYDESKFCHDLILPVYLYGKLESPFISTDLYYDYINLARKYGKAMNIDTQSVQNQYNPQTRIGELICSCFEGDFKAFPLPPLIEYENMLEMKTIVSDHPIRSEDIEE